MNHKSKSFVKIVLISSLIFLSYNLPIYTIKLINYEKYGVFLTNDFSEGYFAKAINELASVTPKESRQAYQVVQRDSRIMIYGVSPTAKLLEPYLENINGWKLIPCRQGFCDEVESRGWFIFEIRDAAIETGKVKSAKDFQDLFRKIYDEVSKACNNGVIKCSSPGIIAGIPSFTHLDKTEIIDNYAITLNELINFTSADSFRSVQDVNEERERLWTENVEGIKPLVAKPTYHSEKNWLDSLVEMLRKQYSNFSNFFLFTIFVPFVLLYFKKVRSSINEILIYSYFVLLVFMHISIHSIMDAAVMENIGARYLIQSQTILIVVYFYAGYLFFNKLFNYLRGK